MNLALRSIVDAVLLVVVPGCGEDAPRCEVDWSPNPNPRAPLALIGVLRADRPVSARVWLDDGERPRVLARWGDLAEERELLALGLHPATRYTVTVKVTDAEGRTGRSEPFHWTSPPLPASFPQYSVTVCRPELMEPGVTLIPAQLWPGRGDPERDFGPVVALDEHGEVVWFYDAPHAISEIKRMSTGNLLYYHGTRGNVVEMDMLGNVVRQWYTMRLPGTVAPEGGIPIDASTIHHDVQELPSGNFLALSTELRRFESYPRSEDDPSVPPGPARVVGGVILEFTPDGTVVNRWSVLDLPGIGLNLPTRRAGWGPRSLRARYRPPRHVRRHERLSPRDCAPLHG